MKKLFSLVLISILALGYTRAQVVTLFSENFANGIPAGWYNGGTSLGSPNAHVKFEWFNNQTHGSPYDYTVSQGVITSPTRSNGYAMFDSDSLDAGSTGTPGSGPAPVNQICTLALPGINVTGYPKLRLQFYQYLSNYQTSTVVAISYDSINWTLDTLNAAVGVNSTTALVDEKTDIDISPIINGHDTAYIQFIINADYYFWDIDDITLTSLPNNDIKVTQDAGQAGTQNTGFFYSSIPLSEADSFAAVVNYSNTGGDDQPDVNAAFNFYENNNLIASDTATPIGVLPYATDSFGAVTFYTQGIGSYKVTTKVYSDSVNYDSTDNQGSFNFAVTDSVYAISNSNTVSNSYFLTRNAYGLIFQDGVIYELDNQDTVTSITTAIQGGTDATHAGAIINASIYAVTISGSSLNYNATSPVVSTIPRTLASGDLTTGATIKPITLPIDYHSGNAVLAPGLYWVAITGTPAPNDSNVLIVTTTYANNGFPAAVEENPQPSALGYFSNTDAPYCNMNLGHASSLLWADWTRNPATNPVKAGQNVTFTGTSNATTGSPVYTWTFYSDSDSYFESYDTGNRVTVSFLPSATSATGKDVITACVTVTDGGASASYCNTVNVRPIGLGIDEVSQLADVSLIPNPTTGKVNISASGINGTVSISVENMLGEVVKTYEGEANGSFSQTYDLSTLTNGIYLVKISNAGAASTKKLSISK